MTSEEICETTVLSSSTGIKRTKSSPMQVKVDVKNEEDEEPARKKMKTEEKTPPTGREVITQFLKGDVTAAVTYRKICNALEVIESWEADAPKIQLLEQFLNIADVLDNNTELLVNNLLKIRWDKIPASVMQGYYKLLCDIGVRQLCYTESVYKCAVERLSPQVITDEETSETRLALEESVQQDHYTMAHNIISHILNCFPMSSKVLLKCVRMGFPHFTQAPLKVAGYMRNLIVMQKYASKGIRKDIWTALFERLVKDDAHNWRIDQTGEESNSPALFAMDGDSLIADVDSSSCTDESSAAARKNEQMSQYLDTVCTDVMTWLQFVHGIGISAEDETRWQAREVSSSDSSISTREELFEMFLSMLESTMLTATHVRHVSFIWLFLCSLRPEYESKTLDSLWMWACRLPRAPADTKKSQGASAYLAAFLARAKYVNISTAYFWLEEMFQWLRRYIDQFGSGSTQILPGLQRHGTFYAISQAFFLVFAFRYRDLVKHSDKMNDIRHWAIGRVVHSPLEPLKFVARPVALCFSAITRSLQLVYCNHVIPVLDEVQRPFEEMFPFDSYHLKVSSGYVTSLMRRFSPLAEDVNQVAVALSWNAMRVVEKNDTKDANGKTQDANGKREVNNIEMDFFDDDDFAIGSIPRERSGTFGQSSLINYSATPGLKSFAPSS